MRLMVKASRLSLAHGLAFVLVGLFAVLRPAAAAAVPTGWDGAYEYGNGQEAVPFRLDVTVSGTALRGTIVEVQTFGDDFMDGTLGARISGTLDGTNVRFTKVYDGTGGVSHSVVYNGTLAQYEDGSWVMFGTWSTGGVSGGWFATSAKD